MPEPDSLPPEVESHPQKANELVVSAVSELEHGCVDGPALSRLAGLLWPIIDRFVRARGWGLEDQESTACEILAVVLSRLPQYRSAEAAITSWALGVARLTIQSQLRRRQEHEHPAETTFEISRRDKNHLKTRLNDGQRGELLEAVLQLPEEDYRLLYLSLVEKQSATEVAEALELSPAGVRKKKERLLKRFGAVAGTLLNALAPPNPNPITSTSP